MWSGCLLTQKICPKLRDVRWMIATAAARARRQDRFGEKELFCLQQSHGENFGDLGSASRDVSLRYIGAIRQMRLR
jgi:hypothetical protein